MTYKSTELKPVSYWLSDVRTYFQCCRTSLASPPRPCDVPKSLTSGPRPTGDSGGGPLPSVQSAARLAASSRCQPRPLWSARHLVFGRQRGICLS